MYRLNLSGRVEWMQLAGQLQLGGWGSWPITLYLGMVVWTKPDGTYAVYLPLVATMGMLITLLLRSLYRAVWEKEIL